MSGPRVDGTLAVPPAPSRVPVLENLEGVLALPGPAGPGKFLAEAGVVRITGWERGDVDEVVIGGRTVVAGLSASAGTVANVVATPSSVRRERMGPLGPIQETTLALASQRGAVVQWKSTTRRAGTLTLRLRLAGGGGEEVRYRLAEHALVLRPASEKEDRVVIVHPPPASWTVVEGEDGGLAVEIEAPLGDADGTVTLAVATQEPGKDGLGWLPHIDAHQRRGQGPPWDEGGVHTATGVAELDDGVGWLTARIAAAGGAATASGEKLLWWGMGALALGFSDAAVRALEALEAGDARLAHVGLLSARIASATGDQGPATRVAARVLATPAGEVSRDPLAAVAATALADALRHAASEEHIQALRARGTPRGMALPMAGAPAPVAHEPPWLQGIMADSGAGDAESDPLAAAITTLRGLTRDDAQAYGAWRSHVAGGLSQGPMGRGTWDPAAGEGAPVAGALACALMHGVLGWDPDAPVGRMTLRPSFPAHVGAFTVHGLGVGDTRISFEYRKDGREHTYAFEPTQGRVPATLVFEPRLVGAAIGDIRMDGRPADLSVKKTRDRVAPSVQISLDGPRILHLTVTGDR